MSPYKLLRISMNLCAPLVTPVKWKMAFHEFPVCCSTLDLLRERGTQKEKTDGRKE